MTDIRVGDTIEILEGKFIGNHAVIKYISPEFMTDMGTFDRRDEGCSFRVVNRKVVVKRAEDAKPQQQTLSRRDEFAKAAMQGLLAGELFVDRNRGCVAKVALGYADALIVELDKEPHAP